MRSVKSGEAVLAKEWLLHSGIQNIEGSNTGGFNAWFELDQKSYSYAYSEITGYGITTLLYLEDHFEGEQNFLAGAVSAAEWLMTHAIHPCGGVKTRDYYHATEESHLYSFDSDNIYAFDNGMVLYGIVNLYKRTGEKKYLDFARYIAEFLIKDMLKEDGLFFAVFNVSNGTRQDDPWKWSSQSGSYHAKLALGFTDLFDVTGEEKYKEIVLRLCRKCITFQEGSGRFITSRADNTTHLHPHCYSAEGLMYAGAYFGEDEFIESATHATTWIFDNQLPDGGIPKKFTGKEFMNYYRSDILAQSLRLGLLMGVMDKIDETYFTYFDDLRKKLIDFQYMEENDQAGGFFYGTTLDGSEKQHLNSWCTMFAVQALIMYDRFFDPAGKGNLQMGCFI